MGPDQSAAPLSISLFGTFEVRLGGVPLPRLRTRKGQWLLALLTLRQGGEVGRAWLAGTLWPDSPDSLSLASLRMSLKDLRRALGPEGGRLRSWTSHSLSLDMQGAAVDVVAFDAAIARGDPAALAEAVALYRGPLLEGWAEEWVFQERQAREQAYLTALETLAADARARGHLAAAEEHLRRAAAVDPLREGTQRAVMQVLAAGGNYAAALQVYRELRLRLHRDLNAEPDPETQSLFEQMRAEARQKARVRAQGLGVRDREVPSKPTPDAADTLTFLFADIAGSTRLWEQHPEAMPEALAQHEALLRQAIGAHGGILFKTVGDECCAAFPTGPAALRAALAAQQALLGEAGGQGDGETGESGARPVPPSPCLHVSSLRVRMALHTATALERAGDYLGPGLNRVARLLAAAHGGQILLSRATQELVRDDLPEGASLRDLGLHRLKDLQQPEHLFLLLHPSLPAELSPVRSLEAFAHNLPIQVTSFIGREAVTAEVKRLLASTRLLTLTGAGGCGKTRLALQVAADLLDAENDGAWFVDLAPLADPALVPQVVAAALGIREAQGQPLTQTLVDALLPKKLLLILDNCEHLLEACAALAEAILRRCPGVQILATSRERLNLAGETTYRVPSLVAPDPSTLNAEPSTLTQYEAVRLFIDRAIAVVPAFAVTNANAPAVAEICHRLDGIPLAIELAAARVRVLSPEQIAARLDDRFRLLTGGSRASLPRQQTLRALIDWSYDLLSEPERTLLRRLSVFAGGWTLEAAEALSSGEEIEDWEVLDLLTALVDKSLVVEEPGAETRFTMLEMIREYTRERLAAVGETEALRERHARFFLALVEAEWTLPDQYRWFDRLEREHDNLRAALRWAAAQGAGEVGLRLVGGLGHFWVALGYVGEGREHLARSLALPGAEARTAARARALAEAGMLARAQWDYRTAASLLEESLAVFHELGDKPGAAGTLHHLAEVAMDEGDLGAARTLWEQSLTIFRELGAKGGIAGSFHNLGALALAQGDYEAARAFFEQSLPIWRELGGHGGISFSLWGLGRVAHAQCDCKGAWVLLEEALAIVREHEDRQGIAAVLVSLGAVVCDQGDYGAARALFEDGLVICAELGYQREILNYLEGMAGMAAAQGQFDRAARLFATADGLRETTGSPLPPAERAGHDRSVAAVRTALGEGAFAAAWAEGRALSLDEAIALALQEALAG